MNQYGLALLGLTALVAMLVGVLTFAVLRFAAAAKSAKRNLRETSSETALLSAALQDAVKRLKAQEQAMSARAVASEELSGQIVDSLTAGLLVVDSTGRIEILNPAGRRLLGLPDDVEGTDYRTLLAGAPALVAVLTECLTNHTPIVRRTMQVPTPDGASSYLGVTVSPLGNSGHSRGVICLFSDLTNVVELEEQLRLKEALARLGELTAGIAHEFRNGLATIHGYARLMDPQALPAPYGPYVEAIRQETESLGRIVTNFLNFARPDQMVFVRVDLGGLVESAVEEIRHDSPDARISVRGEFGTVEGDEVLLRQMLVNLVRNGVEAVGKGRIPEVVVEGRIDRKERICRFVVDDNGPGIDPAVRDRVFRPFFTTKAQGTGLGLAIVQKVVVTHNGRIVTGASSLGGARFEVALPASGPEAELRNG